MAITTTPQTGTNNTASTLKMVETPGCQTAARVFKFLLGINMIDSITQ